MSVFLQLAKKKQISKTKRFSDALGDMDVYNCNWRIETKAQKGGYKLNINMHRWNRQNRTRDSPIHPRQLAKTAAANN
jgi:hypothetical protein